MEAGPAKLNVIQTFHILPLSEFEPAPRQPTPRMRISPELTVCPSTPGYAVTRHASRPSLPHSNRPTDTSALTMSLPKSLSVSPSFSPRLLSGKTHIAAASMSLNVTE